MEPFVNKVAESGIITLNLEDYYPKEEVMVFDMKDHLFMGLILKEKDFRESLKNMDLSPYTGKIAAITCTADAIIPVWAYMLVASALQPYAAHVVFAGKEAAKEAVFFKAVTEMNPGDYAGQRVVIKGCGEIPIGEGAYVAVTHKLRPVVKSIMYGEPCSTVPIYKKPKV